MTLSRAQRSIASRELHTDLGKSGLTVTDIAEDLDLDLPTVHACLAMDPNTDGSDVWFVRDYLAQAVQDAGGRPTEHTVLSEQTRARARRWYEMRQPPHHSFDGQP